MKTRALNCNNCGAPLEAPERANFVTCGHCRSRLVILHTDNSISTERIDRLDEMTAELAERVAELSFREALDQLDEEWDAVRRRYVARTREGREISPGMVAFSCLGLPALAAVGLIVAIVYGRTEFVVVGALVSVVAILLYFIANGRRVRFDQAYADYLERRENLQVEDFLPKGQSF